MKQLIELTKSGAFESRDFFEILVYIGWFASCVVAMIGGVIWAEWIRAGVWLQNVGF